VIKEGFKVLVAMRVGDALSLLPVSFQFHRLAVSLDVSADMLRWYRVEIT